MQPMNRPIMTRPSPIALLASLVLTGCQATDRQAAPGSWQPIGANESNLLAAVENPADLVHGRSDPVSDPNAVLAVLRYRMGNPKPLPASGLAEIKVTTSGDTAPPAGSGDADATGGAANGR